LSGLVGIHPVVDKDEFGVSFRLIAEAVFRLRAGRLKRDLLAALTIQSVTGAEITVKFEGPHLLLKFGYPLVRIANEVIGWCISKLSLKLGPNLAGISREHLPGCLLGGQFRCGNGLRLAICDGLLLFIELLFQGGNAQGKRLRRRLVFLL